MNPNFPNDFFNSQYYQNFQVPPNLNQNSQFSPNFNEIHTSQNAPTAENVSRNLFEEPQCVKVSKTSWCVKEDVALMSAWIFVSEDSVRGKNQKRSSLWARVHKLYHEHQVEQPNELNERNIDALKGRYKRLKENASKWIAAYKEAYSRRKRGMNDKDVEKEAHVIYATCGAKFQDLIVFNEVMSKYPKWVLTTYHDRTRFRPENEEEDEEESHGSSKRSKTSDDVEVSMPSNAETPSSGCSNISRPIGRDKSKKKGKGKMPQADFAHEFTAELRALRLSRETDS